MIEERVATGDDMDGRLVDGWFHTGDLGRVDDEGFLWIEGRVSDMINRGGLKVFPEEVAEVIRLSPDVAECAVAGIPDDRLGEVPWAFVVPRDGRGGRRRRARGALPRAPGALQGAGPLRGARRAAPQRGGQGPAARAGRHGGASVLTRARLPAMIRLSVLYPKTEGAKFDHDYYRDKHVPLAVSTWGVERVEIDKGVNGPYEAAVHFFFPSTDAIGAAMGAEGTGAIMADVANYTDIQPVMQTSEIVES